MLFTYDLISNQWWFEAQDSRGIYASELTQHQVICVDKWTRLHPSSKSILEFMTNINASLAFHLQTDIWKMECVNNLFYSFSLVI